ncbi:MAG TPA: glycosyltransferase family 4 protein [Methylomirabilota bacterium]|jgi:glycosyltransferase involved in cell wall biosynthesis|nr:glycosyltransferase family 4 protein [Methylomirabilota bacterium]
MHIAQVAPLVESVPPHGYGGTERVVAWLTEELVRRGHRVTLFASGDSRTSARLVAPYPRALRLDAERPDSVPLHVALLADVIARASEFDVIHAHADVLGFLLDRAAPAPVVHTLHGRLDLPALRPVFARFPDTAVVSISNHQRRALADLDVHWVATVHHGLPVTDVPFDPAGGGYLAFLGRMSPEKRPDLAIEVARRLGIPLRIAAKVDAADAVYFEREMRPLLDSPLVDFVGELDDTRKLAFLRGARCLLFPIDWPEPFGLVMIEALACGTPVVARPAGSVPEIVEDGVTGYLGETVGELARAVKRIDLIDRATCRRRAEERFSVGRMTDDYEAVYRSVAAARRRAA